MVGVCIEGGNVIGAGVGVGGAVVVGAGVVVGDVVVVVGGDNVTFGHRFASETFSPVEQT